MNRSIFRWVNRAFLLLGFALLVGLFARLDVSAIADRMIAAGWAVGAALLAYLLGLIFSTLAWRQTIRPPDSGRKLIPFGKLFVAFWAGHAFNAVSPAGAMGEVLKGTLLADSVATEEIIASLVIHGFLTTVVETIFAAAGPLAVMLAIDGATDVALVLFGASLVMFLALLLFRALIHSGLVARMVKIAGGIRWLHISNVEHLAVKAAVIDQRIRDFRKHRPSAFRKAIFYLSIVRITQLVEVWLLLLGLMPDKPVLRVLMIGFLVRTAAHLISWIGLPIPGRVGVFEGGQAALFNFLGMDPALGLSFALLRRARTILGIAVGLTLGSIAQLRIRRVEHPPARDES